MLLCKTFFEIVVTFFNGILSAALAGSGDGGDARPHAYLNYILFDRTYVMVGADARRVPLQAGFDPGLEMAVAPQLTRFDNPVTVGQAGYVYVWVSNESENSRFQLVQFYVC